MLLMAHVRPSKHHRHSLSSISRLEKTHIMSGHPFGLLDQPEEGSLAQRSQNDRNKL
jgi:hypothetical protein